MTFIVSLLRGAAYDWYQHYETRTGCPGDWTTLRLAMLERFGTSICAEKARAGLYQLKQDKMTVLQYADAFESYLAQIGDYDESYYLIHFIFGLRPEIMQGVYIQQPESLLAAKNMAEKLELTHQLTGGQQMHTKKKKTNQVAQHSGTQERRSSRRYQKKTCSTMQRQRQKTTDSQHRGCISAHRGAMEASCPEFHGPAAVWRSMLRDLPPGDRAGRMRRQGSVMTVSLEALAREKEVRTSADATVAGMSMHPPSGRAKAPRVYLRNRLLRRDRERKTRDRVRERQYVTSLLETLVSPTSGGTESCTGVTTSRLQDWRSIGPKQAITGEETGVGTPQEPRTQLSAVSTENQSPIPRTEEDGILLVVPVRIFGHEIRALIDSGATRCFISPAGVMQCGLTVESHNTFLELGDGKKVLSRGRAVDVPVVTSGYTMRTNLTVSSLLHGVDVVLGMTWLKVADPLIRWSTGQVYIPDSISSFQRIMGHWLDKQVKVGTVKVLSTNEELESLKQPSETASIEILKSPQFWAVRQTETQNSWRSSHAQGSTGTAKFFEMIHPSFGMLKVQKLNNNAALPKRSTDGAAGYDLCASQNCTIPAKGKGLVKTGLSLSFPSGLYARIAPRSGLALKKFIDVGAGVVDADYRGEVGVVLFNHGDQDFEVKMGDRIAQLILEKISTPEVEEVSALEDTVRGTGGFGSTGVKGKNDTGSCSDKKNDNGENERTGEQKESVVKNETLKGRFGNVSGRTRTEKSRKTTEGTSRLSRERQIISVKQLKRLVKKKTPVFLAVVWGQESRKVNAAVKSESIGLTEGKKRDLMKQTGPKKRFLSVEEREAQILERVDPGVRGKLKELVDEFKDVFPDTLPKGRPPKRDIVHEIRTEEGAKPPSRPPYRLSPSEQDEMEEQVKDLLAQGFIRPSASPYGAPILFVPKKDGRWRMCIDYRALNKQTVKDQFPLPRIDSLLERLGQATVFTKLDLASGYHQIAMEETSIQKTAFRTNRGQFEFLVMPFGLCNAPASFQRLMNKVFADNIGKFIAVYLDDILIFSRNIDEHWRHLRWALEKLREAKLYGRLHKCEFLKDQVDYLGFEVSPGGIKASPGKVKAVIEWPKPKSVHDVRSFLGLASYYRRFVRGFSEMARPLTELTRAGVEWRWSTSQHQAFNRLKLALTTAPVLKLPDFQRQFVVTTDASDAAVGAILEQDFGNGLQPVAFASRKLNNAEMRYSAYERELLGIVWALAQWKHYCQGPHSVVIQTDHAPLRHLPNQASVNARVWKWINIMQGYNLEIRHIPGKRNPADTLSRQDKKDALGRKTAVNDANADLVNELRIPSDADDEAIQEALLRLFNAQVREQVRDQSVSVAEEGQAIRAQRSVSGSDQALKAKSSDQALKASGTVRDQSSSVQSSADQPKSEFKSSSSVQDQSSVPVSSSSQSSQCKLAVGRSSIEIDNSLRDKINSLLREEILYKDILEEIESTGRNELLRGQEKYKLQKKLLMIHVTGQPEDVQYWRVVVPDDLDVKSLLVSELHSVPYSAHPGVQRTIGKVRRYFWWKGMAGDIREFVEACPTCQLEKSDHTLQKGSLQSLTLPEVKWQEVSVDFITDLPAEKDAEDSIMTVVDRATKMVHLIPCWKTTTAGEAARLFWQHVVKLHGVPRAIHTDRGAQFVGRWWREIWSLLGTKLKYGTAYHPQSQGQVERMNAVVSQTLRCLMSDVPDLSKWKDYLPTVEMVINSLPNRSTGYSPFYLMYGYHPVLPVELLKGDESTKIETLSKYLERTQEVWRHARAQMEKAVAIQKSYYDKKHRDVQYTVGDLVLLSTQNLRLKGILHKLQQKFCGPYKIVEKIGTQAYRLKLPDSWRIHPVFHVSLLKQWKQSAVQQVPGEVELEDADRPEYFEVEKILRWRWNSKTRRRRREFLVLWQGYPAEDAEWIPASFFSDQDALQKDIQANRIPEEQ